MIRRIALASIVTVLIASDAWAHGGVPISSGMQFYKPNGVDQIAYETTFGLLSRDSQGDWRLTCEETKEQGLKLFKVWPDGEVGMAYTSGYLYSNDGCNFTRATGVAASARSLATARIDGPTDVLVLLTDLLDGQESGTNLFVSSDRGRSFQQVHLPKPFKILSMVVSETQPPAMVLTADLVVDDGMGGTARERWLLKSSTCVTNPQCTDEQWTQIQLTDAAAARGTTRVLADIPEGLFLRNVTGEESRLLRSTDGGQTFAVVLPKSGESLPNPVDFVSRVGPNELWLSAGLQHTYHSSDGGATWERRADMGDIRCVKANGGSLHSCVVDLAQNIVASTSNDAGRTWTPELHYNEVAGIKQCPPNSDVGAACDDLWLLISLAFKGPQPEPTPAPKPKDSGCATTEVSVLALSAALLARRQRRSR